MHQMHWQSNATIMMNYDSTTVKHPVNT